MYKNIQIRNALECVPLSQYFSVSREGKRLPQWKKAIGLKKKLLLKKMFMSTFFVLDKDIATITYKFGGTFFSRSLRQYI